MVLVPEADIIEFMKRKSGRFRFPIYINEKLYDTGIEVLELSVRASNCLEQAGYTTVGKLVEKIFFLLLTCRLCNIPWKYVYIEVE